ncbi:MAG TPA: hypothetical protein VM364_04575 [Vicinamibacterales bacterium]|nr:hypothetical protein [Vicinamibacterales bacterium]
MKRHYMLAAALLLAVPTSATSAMVPGSVTVLGWFSDEGCARSKLQGDEEITPNGTACVKKCLDDGATPVFVDPKARAMYAVKNYPAVKEDVGYYLELTGMIDEQAKTITVHAVKRLGDVIQMCGRKPKK